MKSPELARRRMHNSRLVGDPFTTPEEVVHWHGAIQAQDYGPAKWSIAQRAANLGGLEIDRALAEGSIARTHVLRPTWHFVSRDDIRGLLELTGPRVRKHNEPRLRELALDARTLSRCETLIASRLRGGKRFTREAIAGILDDEGIDRSGQRLPYILMHCELEAVICSGALAGKQHTYALLDERVDKGHFDRDETLAELVRRYLTSHGPATVQDLRWWSSLTVADIREALDMLGSEVHSDKVDNLTFWSMGPDAVRLPRPRGAHLLQTYDELIVGYTESRFFGDPRAATANAARRDRRLPTGIVLMNGRIHGYWRRTLGGSSMTVDVLLYEGPTPAEVRALQAAIKKLGRFWDRRVVVESRIL